MTPLPITDQVTTPNNQSSKDDRPPYAKPYQCAKCGKSYEQPQYLNRHVKTDHAQLFARDDCNETFLSTSALISHTKQVHIEADLSCPICDQLLTSEMAVNRHMRSIHKIEETPMKFKCNICNVEFARTQDLNRHANDVHEKRTSFKCTQCQKEFAQKDALSRHLKGVHEKIKNFKCTQCHQEFARDSHLSRHITDVHE